MKRARRAGFALVVAVAGLPACGRSTKRLSSSTEPAADAARTAPAVGPVSSAEVRTAIEKAAAYFAGRELRGDEGWLVVQAAAALGPEFETWATTRLAVAPEVRDPPDAGLLDVATAEARFWQLRTMPQSPLPPLPAPQGAGGSLPPPTVELTDGDLAGIVRLMTRALACTRIPPSGRATLLTEARDPGKSYLLTHQLFALMLAYHQGCLDAGAVDAPRRKLAEALWREQTADGPRVNDLAFERMAALSYAQLCDWIAPSWIEAVVRAQEGSGAWGVGDLHVHPGASATESHTAALGLYVLAGAWRVRFSEGAAPPRPPLSSD